MKKLLLPFLLVLLALPVWAQVSAVSFTAERGELFQVEIDGRNINRTATNYVRVNNLRPGKHYVELRIRSRHGVYKMGQKIFVPDRVEASYGVRTLGRSGKAYLQLISEVPLAPVRPRHPDFRHDDYRDRYEPVPPRYGEGSYGNCRNLFTARELDRLLDTMRDRDFESTKLSIAREALQHNSLTADDLKRILQQFDYETTRLEFAKYAYDRLCDPEHLYYIYGLFRFDSSIRELEEYTRRR